MSAIMVFQEAGRPVYDLVTADELSEIDSNAAYDLDAHTVTGDERAVPRYFRHGDEWCDLYPVDGVPASEVGLGDDWKTFVETSHDAGTAIGVVAYSFDGTPTSVRVAEIQF